MPSLSMMKVMARIFWAVGMDLWVAFLFLVAWIWPQAFGEQFVRHLTFVMLLEFIVIHSSGFLGAVADRQDSGLRRTAYFAGLGALYTLFAAGFAALYGGWWPLLAFWGLLLSRFPTVVLRPPDMDGQTLLMANWAAMVLLYLFGALLTSVLQVPSLGVTPEVIEAQQFNIGGLWPEEPYRVMAFGAFYFTGLGVVAVLNEVFFLVMRRKK